MQEASLGQSRNIGHHRLAPAKPIFFVDILNLDRVGPPDFVHPVHALLCLEML